MQSYIINVYLIVNAFIAGLSWPRKTNSTREYFSAWFFSALMLLFGLPYLALVVAYMGVKYVFKEWINGTLQLQFFFDFYFTKRWSNLSEKELHGMDRITLRHRYTNSIRHRIYRHCIGMINHRHNYTYQAPEHPF